MPTPCAGSRSPDAARGSRARAPLCARAPPLLHRTADPGHAQPAAPSGAVSRPSSRSSRQSSGSPTIGKCARLGGPGPSEPREHGPQGNMGELASSWLHPLKTWSLRKTRYGSVEAVSARLPSGENTANRTAPSWPRKVARASPVSASHSRAGLSEEAVSTRLPSGENTADKTGRADKTKSSWPRKVARAAPVSASHSRGVLSEEAVSTRLPSDENTADR